MRAIQAIIIWINHSFSSCHFRLISSFFFISKLLKIVKINKKPHPVTDVGESCLLPGFNGLLKLSLAAVSANGVSSPWLLWRFLGSLQNRWWYGCLPICTQMCHNTGKTFEVIWWWFHLWFHMDSDESETQKDNPPQQNQQICQIVATLNSSHYGCLNRLMARWDSEDPIWNW